MLASTAYSDIYNWQTQTAAGGGYVAPDTSGEGTVSTVDGVTDYCDQGIFSNGSNSGGTTEPAADTPFAPYYAIEMVVEAGW
ncbi:MAG TPA: hypothetical protein VGG16_18540 [Streptosporangiaceae bacterium]